MTRSVRPVAVLAAALALVLLQAAPSAAVPSVGTITSNFFRINTPTPIVVPLPGGCAAPTLVFDITSVTGAAPNRTATGTVTLAIPRGTFSLGRSRVFHLLASGNLTLTEGVTGQFSVAAMLNLNGVGGTGAWIRNRIGACTPTNVVCPMTSAAGLTLSGGYVGTVSSTAAIAGTADVSVTGTLIALGCGAPLDTIDGSTLYAPISATF